MASIIKKKIKGHVYYYAAESKRVNGKPRIVWQKYLGKVNDIVEAVSKPETIPSPNSARVYRFGVEAALLRIVRRLGLTDVINRHLGTMKDGLTAGDYVVIRAIHECTKPGVRLSDWFTGTVLRRHFSINPKLLTEKRFLEIAEMLTEEVLRGIQTDLVNQITTEFGLGTRSLLYQHLNLPGHTVVGDSQNLYVYPGIAMLVSSDFFVPLFYEMYQTDCQKAASFQEDADGFIERYRCLRHLGQDVTVVKHAYLSQDDFLPGPREASYRSLGLLPKNDFVDLLMIPLSRFHPLKDFRQHKIKVYRCSRRLFGENATVLVVFSEEDRMKEVEAAKYNLHQCLRELHELKTSLQICREGEDLRGKDLSWVQKQIDEMLNNPLTKAMVEISFHVDDGGWVDLRFSVKENVFTLVQKNNLGKTILFTTNHNWDNEEIYCAYKGRLELVKFLVATTRPGYTGAKNTQKEALRYKADVFYSILGLTLQNLLRRELHRYGITGSISDILKTLSEIHEVGVIYYKGDQRVKKREHITISQLDQKQREIYECLRLNQFEALGQC